MGGMTSSAVVGSRTWARLTGIAVVLALTSLRLLLVLAYRPNVFPDTADYLQQANHWPWDRLVLAGARPPGTAWFLTAVGRDPQAAVVAQTLIAGLAWSALILVACSTIRDQRVRLVAGLLLGLVSLSANLLVWDTAVLSDSLSLSMVLLFVSATMLAAHRGLSRPAGAAIVASAAAAAAMRDTNAIMLGLVGLALCLSLRFRLSRAWAGVALALVVLLGLSLASAAIGDRSRAVASDELVRVARHPDQVSFYADRGLPNAQLATRLVRADPSLGSFRSDPRMTATNAWMVDHGMATKAAWVREHPGYALVQPFREPSAVTAKLHQAYVPHHWHPVLPGPVESMLVPRDERLVASSLALALAMLSLGWRRSPVRWVVLGMLGSVPLQLLVVWHGEAIEVPRHGLAVDLTLRIGVIMAAAIGTDSLFGRGVRTHAPEADGQHEPAR